MLAKTLKNNQKETVDGPLRVVGRYHQCFSNADQMFLVF